jgi:hypothetical protein
MAAPADSSDPPVKVDLLDHNSLRREIEAETVKVR